MAMRYTHAMEDAKRRPVEAIAQRHGAIEVREMTRAGEDACGLSKSDRDAMVTSVLTALSNESVHASVKDAKECSYQISGDAA